jgi:hypothetical protein
MKLLLQGQVGASESTCCNSCFGEQSVELKVRVCDYVLHTMWSVVFLMCPYTAIVLIQAGRTSIIETVAFEE